MKRPLHEKKCIDDLKLRDHLISYERSEHLIHNFERNREKIINPDLAEKDREVGIIPFSETFNLDAVRKIIDLPGCEGLRVYTGLDDEFRIVYVLRAIDKACKDILNDGAGPRLKTEPMMMGLMAAPPKEQHLSLDDGQRVPPWPPTKS